MLEALMDCKENSPKSSLSIIRNRDNVLSNIATLVSCILSFLFKNYHQMFMFFFQILKAFGAITVNGIFFLLLQLWSPSQERIKQQKKGDERPQFIAISWQVLCLLHKQRHAQSKDL